MARSEAGLLLDGLIASKLYPPALDPRAIPRTGLIARALDDLPRSRLITIVAPAGWGKSNLMTQLHAAFREREITVGWLGLDAEDNHPTTFALYFISAMHAIEPSFARDELTALGANPVRDFDSLFERLRSQLSTVAVPGALLLDDFQHITDPRILRFLDRLIAQPPPTLSLVMASRHRLPLKLARQLVSGLLIEVAQDDLNFDLAQTRLFLSRYHQIELSPGDLDALLESTEGWPTGVQLAALALRRFKGPAAELISTFSGHDRHLTRYLAETVIHTQPQPVRNFLLRTSPLRRMCADLCDATTAESGSRSMLDYIGGANLFLIPLDQKGIWFRYHHLFTEFLQNEFRRIEPAGYRDACRRAAIWCETNGQPTDAIRYALDAGHFEQAADLIARHALQSSLFYGDHYTVLDWLRRLPSRFHARRPEILLAHAWSCAFSRDTAQAMTISQQVIDALSATGLDRWQLSAAERDRWLLWSYTVQAATKACADDIKDCLTRATALFPQAQVNEPFLVATLSNCLSYSHFALRNFERSRESAMAAHEYGHRADATYLSAWGDFLHGLIDVELGNLRAAGAFSARVQRDSQGLGLGMGQRSYVAGLSALLDAEIAVQRCDFDKASAHIIKGRAFKEIFGPVEPQLIVIRNEARLQAHLGRLDLALLVLREGQDAALREQHHRLYLSLAMEETTLQLTAGETTGAGATTRRTKLLDAEANGTDLFRAKRDALRLLEARLRLANGDAKLASRILTTLQQARGAESRGGFFLAVAAQRAIAMWELGQKNDAARQLDRALSSAAPEFHAYPILSAGRALVPILEYIIDRRLDVAAEDLQARLEFQRWLLCHLCGDPQEPHPGSRVAKAVVQTDQVEPLTRRELEVLKLLHAGLDNRGLADALLVSVPTIKWHLHNIYSKLGVSSRGAAVARGVQLRLE